MDPSIALSRGYDEDMVVVRKQWTKAYYEIGQRHKPLRPQTEMMTNRIQLACKLLVSHATFYDYSRADDCFYAEAVERFNDFYDTTEKDRASLDGDYPCGNEADMLFARRVFSIREMAYLQLGLAAELNPDDLRKAPPFDKIFDGEAMPKIITTADQPTARRGFVNECLGHYAEAIECYEAIEEKGRPADRIKHLREKLAAQA